MTDFSASEEADVLGSRLTALGSDVGALTVEREGDCRGYEWTIEYDSVAGDHVDLEVSSAAPLGLPTPQLPPPHINV